MAELTEAYARLRAWIREFGHEKPAVFIADVTSVLDDLAEARKRAAELEAALKLSDFNDRGDLAMAAVGLKKRVEEMGAIIKQHDLCHDLHGKVGRTEFEEGCRRETVKEYGSCGWADRIAELEAKYDRLVALVERRGFLVTEEHGLEVRLVDDDLAAQRNKIAGLEALLAEREAENDTERANADYWLEQFLAIADHSQNRSGAETNACQRRPPMTSEPQPRIDREGVPICSSECPLYSYDRSFHSGMCAIDDQRTLHYRPCLPAVRAMAVELKRLKEANPLTAGTLDVEEFYRD